MNFIRNPFTGGLISRNGTIPWPPRSPDLRLSDFGMGYLKSKVYQGKTRTISELNEAMQREIAVISVIMLTNVIRNFSDRLQECINVEGRNLPGVFFYN